MNIHGYRQTRVHTFIPIHTFIPPLVLAPTSACGKRRDIHTFRCKYKRESSYVPGPYIINKSVTGAFLAATSLGRLAQLSLPHQRTRAHSLPRSCLLSLLISRDTGRKHTHARPARRTWPVCIFSEAHLARINTHIGPGT